MNQRGITPIFLVIAVIVLLGAGIFAYKYTASSNVTSDLTTVEQESANASPEVSSPTPQSSSSPTSSPTIKATPKPTIVPTPNPTPVPAPELVASITKNATSSDGGVQYRVFASWKNVANPTSRDWLGVFKYGQEGDEPIDGKVYTAGCAKKDQMDFNMPAINPGSCPLYLILETGIYEVRLYSNDGTTRLATSGQTTITNP